MRVKLLLLITLIFCYSSHAQNAVKSKSVLTVIATDKVSAIEKRATLRILLSHMEGSVIEGYNSKDKAFLISSTDEAHASSLRREVQRLYPEANVQGTNKDLRQGGGFTQVQNRIIKQENGFPVFVETGDNQLDELSYSYEKDTWLKQNPTKSK